jgi:hypothetical protein
LKEIFTRYKYYGLAAAIFILILLSQMEFFSYDGIIISLFKPRLTYYILSAFSICISGAHFLRFNKLSPERLSRFDSYKEIVPSLWDIFSDPVPFIGSYVILKLYFLSKFAGFDHLKDLDSLESLSLVYAAGYIFIYSGFELYKKAKDLKIQIGEISPADHG